MPDSLCFVQFPHPGGEPPVHEDWVHWNSSDTHARKCLQSPGRWRKSASLDAVEHEGDLVFWGEWEPPSRTQSTRNSQNGGWPRYIHIPFWQEVLDKGHFHNTDPYVFGKRFRYSNCRQNTKNGPRTTQRLATGSLIVFGSPLNGAFVVDTVFVVGGAQSVSRSNLDKLLGVDRVFRAVVLDLLYRGGGAKCGYRLYNGATPDAPVNGMFSFFPCLRFTKALDGFPRPAIRLDDLVNPECKQNFKLRELDSLKEMETLWRRVVRQIMDAGLYLGVYAATPEKVPIGYRALNVRGARGGC